MLATDSNIFLVYGSFAPPQKVGFTFFTIELRGDDGFLSTKFHILLPIICPAFINPYIETVPTANSRHTDIAKSCGDSLPSDSSLISVGSL